MVTYLRTLDMKRGALVSSWHPSKAGGVVVRLRSIRLVSLVDRGFGLEILSLDIGEQAEITLEASCLASDPVFEPILLGPDLGIWRIGKSSKSLAIATAAALRLDGREVTPVPLDNLKWRWKWKSRPGQIAYFERLVSFARAERLGGDSGTAAQEATANAPFQRGTRAVRTFWRMHFERCTTIAGLHHLDHGSRVRYTSVAKAV
jgi:hypothetical protein